MKKFTIIPLLSLILIFFSSGITKNSFVDTKWRIDDPSINIEICFKSDGTFWHYYSNSKVHLDSLLLCKWGIEKDQMYLFDESTNLKFNYMTIISCNKNSMVIRYIDKKREDIKLIKRNSY